MLGRKIPSFSILEASVVRFTPKGAAVPWGPSQHPRRPLEHGQNGLAFGRFQGVMGRGGRRCFTLVQVGERQLQDQP
jgi:hypothetical protein